MKQSGKTTLFALVCIAVLLGAYGVGRGVRKVRFGEFEEQVSADAKPEDAADESDDDAVAASENAEPESADDEPAEEVAQEEEEPGPRPERGEGRRGMMGEGMRERFQNMSDEEKQEAMAQMRARFGGRGRGEGGGRGGFSQISEEDRESLRAEMEEIGARADEMSEEELQQARREVMEKYGITPREGGRRQSGGGGGTAPPKGRACFVAETPVWINGKLVQISKVTVSQTVGRQSCGALPLERVQAHEGTFECRDIALASGNTIGVVGAHCFMLDSGKWIAAQNLTSGMKLKTLTGAITIKSVTKRAVPYTGKVYNLKVKGSDRYLVGKDVVIVRDY